MSFTDDEERSCLACPSFLTADEARAFFNEDGIRTPMCARFGKILGTPSISTLDGEPHGEAVIKSAAKCKEFGHVRPSVAPGDFTPVIFFPETKALEAVSSPSDEKALHCYKCVNSFTSAEHGIVGCKPRGIQVLAGRIFNEATGCNWNKQRVGTELGIESGHKLLPPFDVSVAVKRRTKKATFGLVSPGSYESDAPISDAHKGMIRAWRSVELPKGKTIHVPIFETSYFDEADQELIPKAGDSNADPSLYVDHTGLLTKFASVSYKRDMVLTMVGEPGSGKTEGARFLAYTLNMPFRWIQYNEYTEPEQAIGLQQFKHGETLFEPGELPLGWVKPCVFLSDEWNLPQEGIQQVYRSMFDNNRFLKIFNERFPRHDYHFHVAAINPAWDFRNIGAKELASADVRRMSYHWMSMPDRKTCGDIIQATLIKIDGEGLGGAELKALFDIGEDMRVMARDGKIPHHWTLGQDLKVARLLLDWSMVDAFKIAYLDYLDPQTAEVVMSTIKTRIPSGI